MVIVNYNLIFRYWWARLNVLAKQENWKKLEELSKIKRSPIGYEVNQLNLFSIGVFFSCDNIRYSSS